MAHFTRSVGAFALVLVAPALAQAQLPEAPAPHLPLDELVKEYQRWGLPLPAPDARLVRLKRIPRPDELDVEDPDPYLLAFFRPSVQGGRLRSLTGDERLLEYGWVENAVLDRPTRADATAVDYWRGGMDWLRFVVAFRLRGWDDAAEAVYARGRAELATEKLDEGEPPLTVLRAVRECAAGHWYGQLLNRHSDRREVLARLRELIRLEPHFRTPKIERTLRDLELTVAPRKANPGKVEALIDRLTEHWVDDWTGERDETAYWELAALGFDAVPALIEHLTDRRLTRSQFEGSLHFEPYTYRVGHLASRLLVDLSGGQLHYFEARGDTVDPGAALKWWGTARELSEERWLLDHALPVPGRFFQRYPCGVALRALRVKYPHRLADVYRSVLLKQSESDPGGAVTAEIAASELPRARKVALLEEGVAHHDFRQRRAALEALVGVDVAAFRKHFVRLIANRDPDSAAIGTIGKTDDPACWDALLAATRRADSKARLLLVNNTGWASQAAPKSVRRACLHYLLAFRDDTATGELLDKPEVVRDEAATQLAFLLGLARPLTFELPQGPRERSVFRERVWALAERELGWADR